MARLAKIAALLWIVTALLSSPVLAAPVFRQRIEGVHISLTIDKGRYTVQEEMKITLTVRNRSMATVSYRFPSSQWFELYVLSGGRVLWAWSYGKAFTQAFTTLVLDPGQSRSFSLSWGLKDNSESPLGPGQYAIVAIFPVTGRVTPTVPGALRIPFTIAAGP